MNTDWYRKKNWTATDEDEFFDKLSRARKDNRPEHLKIQAMELAQTDKPVLLNIAERLLNQLLSEYPDDKLTKSASLHTLGKIHQRRNHLETALKYYQQAVDFEKLFPNVKTDADFDFSSLVIKLEKTQHFALAQQLMESRVENAVFPIEKYSAYSILAAINKSLGKQAEFNRYQKLAKQSADQKTSELRYHQHLGVVKEPSSWWGKIFKKR